MIKIKAIVLQKAGDQPKYKEIMLSPFQLDWIDVDVLASALNHRDIWICKGKYPGIKFPAVLGSDACVLYQGKEFLLLPGLNWGTDHRVQSKEYKIFGGTIQGSFSQKMFVPENSLFEKPAHLDYTSAAALPLAGLTAYRALFVKGALCADQNVLINGIGGGVAMLAFQFALAIGANVYVTSSSYEKCQNAISLGALGSANYREQDWAKALLNISGYFDLVVDSAGGDGFSELVKLTAPGGKIVIYGGGQGKINHLSPQKLFWKQISVHGTTMGSPEDFLNMLSFVNKHGIVPKIDQIYALQDFEQAFQKMENGEQLGKLVFDHQK